jgi:surface antigen
MGHQVDDYNGINPDSQPKSGGSSMISGEKPGKPVAGPGKPVAGIARMIAVAGLCISTAACSLSDSKLAGLQSEASLVNGSVSTPVKNAGIASTDAEIIKSTVAHAKLKTGASTALAWVNPDTGSSGTIMAIDNYFGKHGQKCRVFKTTVSTFMGIAFYDGEACQISPKEWVLSWFRPAESKS